MSLNLYKYHSDPESLDGFDEYMHQNPDVAYDIALNRGHASEQLEDAIATDAWYSYLYAKDVLKGERVEKIEDAIATDAYYSYLYARDVLSGERFEKGEDAIATSALYSYWYAQDVLSGERFEKGEDAIRGSKYQKRYEELTGVKL